MKVRRLYGNGPIREIPLTQGQIALVDEEDYEWLSQYNWLASSKKGKTCYAGRHIFSKGPFEWMHRKLLGLTYGDGKIVDHINRNGLDNRRCNIRIANKSLNSINRPLQRNNTSGYRGIYWDKKRNLWEVQIKTKGIRKHLGRFADIKAAALAFDKEALRQRGEMAVLNFPNGD